MIALSARSSQPELMDGDKLSVEEFAAVMADLAQVNSATRAAPPTLSFIRRTLRGVPIDTPVTILDVGFGDGDMLRALARMLRGRSAVHPVGYDINPRSAPTAQARTPSDLLIDYVTGDAFTIDPAKRVDFVISSLVTHHMADEVVVRFLAWMEARAAHGWFVNTLHRNAIAYHGFRLLAAIARWNPIVRHDGAVSVSRMLTRADWRVLIARAGLDPATINLHWRLPFRWRLARLR